MAITKTSAKVEGVSVSDGIITATVNYAITDGSTSPATEVTRVRVDVVVSNATQAELAAVQSVIGKAAVLAVA